MAENIVYRNAFSMGTRLDMVIPGISEEVGDSVCLQIRSELLRVEDKISIYKESSNFSELNRDAPLKPVKTDKEVFLLIHELIHLSEKTLGYFDFGMGKITEHNLKGYNQSETDGKTWLGKLGSMGVKNIITDQQTMSVFFKSDSLKIDSGGFGKGYGLDCVKKVFESWKIDSAFISFGESSILAHGNHPYGNAWQTGLQNMFLQDESLFVFDLRNEALSVSGITPLNMKKYGGGHVMDPHTGIAMDAYRQAAVSGKSGLVSEVLSTALLCASQDHRPEIMDHFPEYKAIVVDYDQQNKPVITFSYNTKDGRTN